MLTDLQIATFLQSQYDGADVFDYANRIGVVSVAVKHFPDCTGVFFEGSYNFPDWVSNFKANMIQVDGLGGVEFGFHENITETLGDILSMIPKDKPVFVGGHSRGSAHADIFGALLINLGYQVTVVVFGSPRPGDHNLAAILTRGTHRAYKNRHDPVTNVPEPLFLPYWPYIHPTPFIMMNQKPSAGIFDTWGPLADHHFYLYLQGIKEINNGQSETRH